MKREYLDYIQDMVNSIYDIESFVDGMDFQTFERDRKTANAVIRSLEVIGEAAKTIPSEIKEKYQDVPWKSVAGMRDKLIHVYFGVDLGAVWQTIREDLPKLKGQIEKILSEFEG